MSDELSSAHRHAKKWSRRHIQSWKAGKGSRSRLNATTQSCLEIVATRSAVCDLLPFTCNEDVSLGDFHQLVIEAESRVYVVSTRQLFLQEQHIVPCPTNLWPSQPGTPYVNICLLGQNRCQAARMHICLTVLNQVAMCADCSSIPYCGKRW